MNIKKNIIKCPKCGAEYLPEEIFYPTSVFNNKVHVVKDEKNKILVVEGKSFNLVESFECEHCGTTFEVTGDTKFSTKTDSLINFEEETTVKL